MRKASARVIEDIHVTAQAANSSARVAYVDNDPIVLAHSRVFRAPPVAWRSSVRTSPTRPRCSPARASVRSSTRRSLCASSRPGAELDACAQAREVVAGYADLIAPGSCVIISCGRCDDEGRCGRKLRKAYTAAALYNHAPGEVKGFLAGLELVPRASS